jgi:hypothetical protein
VGVYALKIPGWSSVVLGARRFLAFTLGKIYEKLKKLLNYIRVINLAKDLCLNLLAPFDTAGPSASQIQELKL